MKPTWTKVYSAPGYPIDPAKQAERDYFVMVNIGVDLAHTPDESMLYLFESISKGSMAEFMLPPEKMHYDAEDIVALNEMLSQPKCTCPACIIEEFFGAVKDVHKHRRRQAMIQTEDFQSRLMAIEVKERGI